MVFTEISGPSNQQVPERRSKKTKDRGDLEDEFGMTFKPNEGQAAEHGIYYDDTEYDYMQHMRELGSGSGAVTWIEAPSAKQQQGKGKGKQKLEDALRDMGLGDDTQSEGGASLASSRSLLPDDAFGSEFVKKTSYQDQQNIPDALAGFQPDMDPRLREALEALEDEAYVDDEDDIFAELAGGGEVDPSEWEDTLFEDGEEPLNYEDDEGWESDHTIKPDDDEDLHKLPPATDPNNPSALPAPDAVIPPSDPADGAWLAEFSKYKRDAKSKAPGAPSAQLSAAHTGLSSLASTRHKKRKGAKTSTTNYSMTSSALARTDTQTLLDDRFDKLLNSYEGGLDSISEFDDESYAGSMVSGMTGRTNASKVSYAASAASGMSRASGISTYSRADDSEAPQLVRSDFDSIMDGFLDGHAKVGRKGHVKKGVSSKQTGMQNLDEVRFGLGPARFTKGRPANA